MPKCKIQEHDIQCNWKKTTSKIFSSQRTEKIDTKKDQNGRLKGNQQRNTESIYRYMNTAVGIYQ